MPSPSKRKKKVRKAVTVSAQTVRKKRMKKAMSRTIEPRKVSTL